MANTTNPITSATGFYITDGGVGNTSGTGTYYRLYGSNNLVGQDFYGTMDWNSVSVANPSATRTQILSLTSTGLNIIGTGNKLGVNSALYLWTGAGNLTGNIVLGSSNSGSSLTTGVYNTIIGTSTGSSLTTGYYNTIIGVNAGKNLITGYSNTIIGVNAGENLTGYDNTIIGVFAGTSLTTGYSNTIIGVSAGLSLANGTLNVFMGYEAGRSANSGSGNLCIGNNAGYYITTASNQVCVGGSAGINLTTGELGVYLGVNTTASSGNASSENVIGAGVTGKGTNTTKIGLTTTSLYLPYINYINDYNVANTNNAILVMTGSNSIPMRIVVANSIIYIANDAFNAGVQMASGANAWSAISDRRMKENIEPLGSSLSALLQLNPVSYNFIGNTEKLTKDVGFIAQEVADIPLLKNITSLTTTPTGEERYTITITDFIPYLVKGFQEQHAEIVDLKEQLASLKATVDILTQKP